MDLASQDSDVINKEMDEIPIIVESEEVEVIEVIEYYATDSDDPENANSLEPENANSLEPEEKKSELQKNITQNICTENLESGNENVPVITDENVSLATSKKRRRFSTCLKKCHLQINEKTEDLIFKSYWAAESNTARKRFLMQMIIMVPGPNFFGKFPRKPKYEITYYLDTDNGLREFCRSCFTNILDERESVITAILEDKLRKLVKWKEQQYLLREKTKDTSIETPPSSEKPETFSPTAVGKEIFGNNKPPSFEPWNRHCGLRLHEDDQFRIFKSYWHGATFESRFTFINEMAQFITRPPAKVYRSKFFLNAKKGYQKVCQNCFRLILGESESVIKIILDDKWRETMKSNLPQKNRSEEWIAFVNREGKRQKDIESRPLQDNLEQTSKPEISNQSQETCVVKEEIDLGSDDPEFQVGQVEKISEVGLEKIVTSQKKRRPLLKETISTSLRRKESTEEDCETNKISEIGLEKSMVPSQKKAEKKNPVLRRRMRKPTKKESETEKISKIGLAKIVVPSQKQDKKKIPVSDRMAHNLTRMRESTTEDCETEEISEIGHSKIVVSSYKQDEKKAPVSDRMLQDLNRMREYTKEYCETEDTQETLPEFSNYTHLLLQNAMEDITGNTIKKRFIRLPLCKNKCAHHVTEQDQKRIFETYWENATSFSRYKYINDMVDIIPSNRIERAAKRDETKTFLSYYYLDTRKGRHKVCISCFCTAIYEQRAFVTLALRAKKRSALKEYRQSKKKQPERMEKESNSTDEFTDELNIDYDSSSPINEEKLEDQTRDQMSVKNLINRMRETDSSQASKLSTIINIGRFATNEQLEEVEKQINKFPLCESHNFNDLHSGTCLPMGLRMDIAYELYGSEAAYPVDFSTYEEILKQRDLKFKPDLLGKCEICYYTAKYAKNHPTERNIITSLRVSHLADFEETEKSKFLDLNLKARPFLICTFGFQQSLPTPFLSIPKAFYKQPLWTYNFVVQQLVKNNASFKDSNFYMWHEAIGKKAGNEMASCLFKYLEDLPRHIKTVIFYSSSSKGRSRSKAVAMMFANIIHNHKTLECIDHKFLVDGHAVVEENDETSLASQIVRRNFGKVQQPKDWYDAFAEPVSSNTYPKVVAMTPEMFYDFESMGNHFFESCIDDKIKWLRFTRNGVFYKNTLSRTNTFKVMNLKLCSPSIKEILGTCKRDLCNIGIAPITRERKEDLLDLVNLMSPVLPEVEKFYATLHVQEEVDERSSTKRKLQEVDQEKNDSLLRETYIVKEEVDFENGDLESLIEEEEPPKKMFKERKEIDSINFEHIFVKEEYY